MGDSQMTRPSLLVRIRDARDGQAWAEFVELYSPFVYRYARRWGLQDADAADVTQEVLRTVVRALNGFEHGQRGGSFRRWLVTIARTQLRDFALRRRRQVPGSGDTQVLRLLSEQPSGDDEDELLEREYQKCVFQWAVGKIRKDFRDSTWQAFWQTNMEGKGTKQVAEALGMTVDAVYMARSRVLARLRKEIRQLEL